ncbi:MAG: glycosyltransferase, partial [Flavobacteriales bacterium]|nr:glycosyltransferase [Flavobacteriales bacterium]
MSGPPAPKVSILCTAYNHGAYIRAALEGFVSQVTDFPFEVVVHDDASTDGTADIIREYEQLYPQIVRPIYQTENQYSRN